VPTPQSANRDRFTPGSEVAHSNYHKNNLLINRSASYSALNKSITAAAEVPTEVELAIPRLDRLNLSEPYPDDLKLLLIGLQAEGAKTRVETQIKLTLVLVTGEGASIDQNGNLSTPTQHSLSRLGNWSHIKLPAYSAIKRKSKKLIKTGSHSFKLKLDPIFNNFSFYDVEFRNPAGGNAFLGRRCCPRK
jgi:hypothetical protein